MLPVHGVARAIIRRHGAKTLHHADTKPVGCAIAAGNGHWQMPTCTWP